MKEVIVFPSGLLTADEKKKLESAGYIVIISDEPQKIKQLKELKSNDDVILKCLRKVMLECKQDSEMLYARDWFARLLLFELK